MGGNEQVGNACLAIDRILCLWSKPSVADSRGVREEVVNGRLLLRRYPVSRLDEYLGIAKLWQVVLYRVIQSKCTILN